ncbi:MAG: 2-dehydropantoate 2-reductase [Lachnospiraceae bacterium]|nr:2-dehydropantoate 2-reductase [Lachnospiraceae bacterium]
MKIRSAAVLGAGAVGSYIIYGLTQKKDIDFCVVADGARKERLEKSGVVIDDKKEIRTLHPAIKTPEQARGVDILFVAVKYTALESALQDIRTIVTPNTVVLSLLNGIDSEEKIAGVIDPGQIVYSLMRVSSERRNREDGRNVVSFDPSIPWGIYLGEKGSPVKSERIEAIEELFAGTSVGVFFVEDIIKDQWAKYASNICYNLPQAVLGLPFKAYFESEHVAFLRQKLFDEVYKVGEALGIEVVEPILGWNSCAGTARFSTLQDLDAGRHTEIDMFTGVLMKKAAEAGVEVPFAEYTHHAIKALEEKNDGKFALE